MNPELLPVERAGRAMDANGFGRWPIQLFCLEDMGIDQETFLQDVRPSFDRMEWDTNDVTNRQIAHLKRLGSEAWRREAERIEGIADPDERARVVGMAIGELPEEKRAGALPFSPHRRRAMRKYRLVHQRDEVWCIEPLADRTFAQAVTDYRALTRAFGLMEPEITLHEGILALLASLAETVRMRRPDARRIDAVVHQMCVVARSNQMGNAAPEGVHQDGADYIVSALVVERYRVRGGVSKVREGPLGPAVLDVELTPGQGIFQADAGSPFWHEVTPLEVEEGEEGHRMAFGVDMHVSPPVGEA